MDYADYKKLPGISLFVDFEKAFDTLEWNFISKTLEVFNFGPKFRNWFSILYNGTQSSVLNGGYTTNYFEISRGVRQGCPLSPFLFILAVELLALKIRNEPTCGGIMLPNNHEAKISQFADDTTIISNNTDSLKSYLQIIEWFGSLSGLKLNKKKTKAMWIGTMKHNKSKILEFKSTKDPIKVLGAFLSYNPDKNFELNFLSRFRRMKTKLNLWLSRDLTLYGNFLLAKALGVSQLIYIASMLSVPETLIKSVQTQLFSFLLNNKKDKIKRLVMYQPLANGGINFINFATMVKSLRLAWISRILSDTDDLWKAIPNYFLSEYGGLSFLLRCNYNLASINNSLPIFYRELLQYFKELKSVTQIFSCGEFILWNNEAITIENHSLYWKSWVERGIYFIQDILNSSGNFLTLDEFQTKFQIKTNFLQYFQLIAAIPSDLKKKAKSHAAPTRDLLETTTISTFPGKTNLDLSVMGCKDYYKLFNESCVIEPTGVKKWKDKFPNDFVDWSNKFLHIYRSSRDNKLRQFSFKLLHRTIVTKKKLNKFRLVNDAACTFCSNPDSIEHTFLDCNVVTSFYSEAFSWFNQTYDTNIYLSNKQITLDDITPVTRLSDPIKCSLHLFVLYLKRYIYTCKSFEKKPDLFEFRKKIVLQWHLEKCTVR